MYALLYRSRAQPRLLAQDLNDIIRSAESRNSDLGITGMLLYAELEVIPDAPGEFLQWIEGPETDVRALFSIIKPDPRHLDVEVLAEGPVADLIRRGGPAPDSEGRLFPIWSMGIVRLSQLPATLDGFLRFVQEWDGQTTQAVA